MSSLPVCICFFFLALFDCIPCAQKCLKTNQTLPITEEKGENRRVRKQIKCLLKEPYFLFVIITFFEHLVAADENIYLLNF